MLKNVQSEANNREKKAKTKFKSHKSKAIAMHEKFINNNIIRRENCCP